jgi:dTDP-4-dehydrorhamnose 3,5-epimerase
MQVTALAIPEVKLITPKRFGDQRGFFMETWNRRTFAGLGLDHDFVQDNHSLSRECPVLRGLHFQIAPHAQVKLVRVVRGRILDVAVDIRQGSPTFGRHVSAELSAETGAMLLVPVGFAHGFVTREPDTEVVYKVTDYYAPDCDRGIAYDDPALGIDWQLDGVKPVLSEKDLRHPHLSGAGVPFLY